MPFITRFAISTIITFLFKVSKNIHINKYICVNLYMSLTKIAYGLCLVLLKNVQMRVPFLYFLLIFL